MYIEFPLIGLVTLAAIIDLRSRRIPNLLIVAGLIAALLANLWLHSGAGWTTWGLGMLTGFALFLPLYLMRGMGAGDVKLIAMVGAFLGPSATIRVALITFIVGGVLTLAVAARNGRLRLLLGNLRTMLMGSLIKSTVLHQMPTIDAAPMSAGKMPYGLAIALGTFIYIALEHGGNMNFLKFF